MNCWWQLIAIQTAENEEIVHVESSSTMKRLQRHWKRVCAVV